MHHFLTDFLTRSFFKVVYMESNARLQNRMLTVVSLLFMVWTRANKQEQFNKIRYPYLERSLSAKTSAMLKDPYTAKTFWHSDTNVASSKQEQKYCRHGLKYRQQLFLNLFTWFQLHKIFSHSYTINALVWCKLFLEFLKNTKVLPDNLVLNKLGGVWIW